MATLNQSSYLQSIVTRYFGPGNVRGSRIKASCRAGSVTVGYNHALNAEGNHRAAADALISKLGWDPSALNGEFAGGVLPSGDYAWVWLPQLGSGPIPALGYRDNGTRADAARVALESYVATNTPQYANEPLEEKVSDLLCDLLHLVRRDGTEGEIIDGEPQSDPTDLLDRARDNFEEEEAEEE